MLSVAWVPTGVLSEYSRRSAEVDSKPQVLRILELMPGVMTLTRMRSDPVAMGRLGLCLYNLVAVALMRALWLQLS